MITRKIYTYQPPGGPTGERDLLLFFAGWGMDEHPFLEYCPGNRDVIICYDYRSLDFDYSILESYSRIKLLAWSMGVWAASYVFADHYSSFHFFERIAVNGTLYPVDKEKGIPENIFYGTLEGLNDITLNKFRRRMCGSSAVFNSFQQKMPCRTMNELRQELECIGTKSQEPLQNVLNWDKIYIGKSDKIFSMQNQINAWKDNAILLVEEEHYPTGLWNELFETKENGSE